MKKITLLLGWVLFVFSFSSCSKSDNGDNGDSNTLTGSAWEYKDDQRYFNLKFVDEKTCTVSELSRTYDTTNFRTFSYEMGYGVDLFISSTTEKGEKRTEYVGDFHNNKILTLYRAIGVSDEGFSLKRIP